MSDLLDILVFQSYFSWAFIFAIFLFIFLTPRLFGIYYFNALLFAQFTLFFNSLTLIPGIESGEIAIDLALHFYFIEAFFYVLVLIVYSYALRYRVIAMHGLRNFFSGRNSFILIISISFIACFNYIQAPSDGSSRIAYMTEAWFSAVKPFIQFVMPLAYVGVFVLLLNRTHRALGYALFTVTILANIATGSKASFAFSFLSAYLILRDLSAFSKFRIGTKTITFLIVLVGTAIILTLNRLSVSISDIWDRFFLSGEATMLTYYSNIPTAACEGLTIFAKMHRGWSRLLGDSSAQNIDTLFGYALMIEKFGVNTFTGPNARVSAYFLCNFPGFSVLLGAVVICVYFFLMKFIVKTSSGWPIFIAIFYPFFISSLNAGAQDFNLIMNDITIYTGLLIMILLYRLKGGNRIG